LTGLDITIPDQPVWQDSDVERFNTSNLPRLSRGSTLAWLGHLNVLEWYFSPIWALPHGLLSAYDYDRVADKMLLTIDWLQY
jgi:hypothetical protein